MRLSYNIHYIGKAHCHIVVTAGETGSPKWSWEMSGTYPATLSGLLAAARAARNSYREIHGKLA